MADLQNKSTAGWCGKRPDGTLGITLTGWDMWSAWRAVQDQYDGRGLDELQKDGWTVVRVTLQEMVVPLAGDQRSRKGREMNEPQTTNEQFDPRVVNVPEEAMFDAFAKGKAYGRYEVDEIRFNEFQRGWRSALDFVNSHVAQR